MISTSGYINIDTDSLEITSSMQIKHASVSRDDIPTVNQGSVHSHDLLEFVRVMHGEALCQTDTQQYLLHEGDAIFFNCGVAHDETSHDPNNCQLISLVCHPQMLYGSTNSPLWKRYFSELLRPGSMQERVLRHDGPLWEREATNLVERAWSAVAFSKPFYELTVREALTRASLLVIENSRVPDGTSTHSSSSDAVVRVETMLSYIERHYANPLVLRQIADAANISVREAQRSFLSVTGKSPIQYLTNYRLSVAQRMLLTTDEAMSTIAQSCGFTSQAYFSRCFREHFGCSPSEYRKRNQNL